MNKNLLTIFFSIVSLIIFFAVIYIGWNYYQQFKNIPPALTAQQIEEIKYDAGARFSNENPGYVKGLQYLYAGKYDEAVEQLKALRPQYPKGTTERNIIDYSIGLFYAFVPERQKEAADAFMEIVKDPSMYNQTTRALSIEGIGRTYATTYNDTLLKYIFADPYFKRYLEMANGDYEMAIYSIALEGYQISKTPITSARLAEKTGADLYFKKYTSDSEKENLVKSFDEYLKAGKNEIVKMADFPGYNSYRSEFLSIYGGALKYVVLAEVGPYTRADVETAYREAYSLSGDGLKPFIILRYGSFLSIVAPNEIDTIEDLSRRLETIPQKNLEPFDAFLRNIIAQKEKNIGNANAVVAVYRSKSPTFDAYVKRVLSQ